MAYAFEMIMKDGTTSPLVRLKPRLRVHSASADAWEICQGLKDRFPIKGFRMLYKKGKGYKFRPDGREFVLR